MATKQIYFIGEYGAGKSHTISELILDPALRAQLVVSNSFAHGTTQETAIDFGGFSVVDTRGLDSGELDDDELIAEINALTHSETLFVWVINGRARRLKTVTRLVQRIVAGRRLVIFINDRNNRPLASGWMDYMPSPERADAIAHLSTTFADSPVTNNHLAIVPLIVMRSADRELPTATLDRLNADALLRYTETSTKRAEINRQMKANCDKIHEARAAFLALVDAEERKGRGLGTLLLGFAGVALAVVALPFVAPLFAGAGLAGAAAMSSGMATIGLGAMATAPLVAGAVGGTVGLVAGGIVSQSGSRTGQSTLAAYRPQRLGVDYQVSAEEAEAIERDQKALAEYYDRLQRAKPCTDSRASFRELPTYRPLRPLPPFEPTAEVSDTQFDGPLYHLLCDAL